jgi:hypothetical protein
VTTSTGPPAPSQDAPERYVPECPYVGLEPFDEKDAVYFFGRERDSALIIANLTASRLTLLYAPSGVGKSSVLRAGVLPQLHHIDDDSYDDLGVPGPAVAYVSAWRDAPLESIAAAVSAAVSRVTGASPLEKVASAPKLSVLWLREVLRQSRVSAIYLIYDQFEEYFLYHLMDRGEHGLTAELGRILSVRDLPVHVLLSVREDALAGLDRFKGRVPAAGALEPRCSPSRDRGSPGSLQQRRAARPSDGNRTRPDHDPLGSGPHRPRARGPGGSGT